MKIYHGSTDHVRHPIVERGRPSTDFGKGFYTTANFEQAARWALNKKRTAGVGAKAIVNSYEVDDALLDNPHYTILQFTDPDEQWLDFVIECRRGKGHAYDIVYGAVANDKIYATITLFESGVLNAAETVARLKVNDFFNQISFHNNRAIEELSYLNSVEIATESQI